MRSGNYSLIAIWSKGAKHRKATEVQEQLLLGIISSFRVEWVHGRLKGFPEKVRRSLLHLQYAFSHYNNPGTQNLCRVYKNLTESAKRRNLRNSCFRFFPIFTKLSFVSTSFPSVSWSQCFPTPCLSFWRPNQARFVSCSNACSHLWILGILGVRFWMEAEHSMVWKLELGYEL